MCRGAKLGTCCAVDCEEQIRCQDTGGYCDAHDPYVRDWLDDDTEDAKESAPLVDDPEKRRVYTVSQLRKGMYQLEMSIRADEQRLADYRARVRVLEAGGS